MSCDCFERVNADLERDNTELVGVDFATSEPRVLVATQRIQNLRDGKRAVELVANHCPFCGASYGPAPEGANTREVA